MEIKNYTTEDLSKLRVIKEGLVWLDENYIIKKYSGLMISKIDDLDIKLKDKNTKNLVLPEYKIELNGKPFGYMTEYLKQYKTLFDYIEKNNIFLKQKMVLIRNIIKELKNIHRNDIAHGDFHGRNILIHKKNISDVKVIDFDQARIKDKDSIIFYEDKLIADLHCLVLDILSVFMNNPLYNDNKPIEIVKHLTISPEFREYMLLALSNNKEIIGIYPDRFIKEMNGNLEEEIKVFK